jgi:proteasome lid subunit RPN8/RPN11
LPRRPTTLRFSPTAWAKLLYLRDLGDSEIGGFGIAPSDDLLFVEDVRLVRQTCSWVHVEFDDESVADYFDNEVDAGRRPEQFARIWLHTHPGNSPQPSGTDEATFERVFGRADWAVMCILARGGQCYARLRYNVGPGADFEISVDIDYSRSFSGSQFELWRQEYSDNVRVPPPDVPEKPEAPVLRVPVEIRESQPIDEYWREAWAEYVDDEETEYGFIRDFR